MTDYTTKRGPGTGESAVVSVRMKPEALDRIDARRRALRLSRSEYLRKLVLDDTAEAA